MNILYWFRFSMNIFWILKVMLWFNLIIDVELLLCRYININSIYVWSWTSICIVCCFILVTVWIGKDFNFPYFNHRLYLGFLGYLIHLLQIFLFNALLCYTISCDLLFCLRLFLINSRNNLIRNFNLINWLNYILIIPSTWMNRNYFILLNWLWRLKGFF